MIIYMSDVSETLKEKIRVTHVFQIRDVFLHVQDSTERSSVKGPAAQ